MGVEMVVDVIFILVLMTLSLLLLPALVVTTVSGTSLVVLSLPRHQHPNPYPFIEAGLSARSTNQNRWFYGIFGVPTGLTISTPGCVTALSLGGTSRYGCFLYRLPNSGYLWCSFNVAPGDTVATTTATPVGGTSDPSDACCYRCQYRSVCLLVTLLLLAIPECQFLSIIWSLNHKSQLGTHPTTHWYPISIWKLQLWCPLAQLDLCENTPGVILLPWWLFVAIHGILQSRWWLCDSWAPHWKAVTSTRSNAITNGYTYYRQGDINATPHVFVCVILSAKYVDIWWSGFHRFRIGIILSQSSPDLWYWPHLQ